MSSVHKYPYVCNYWGQNKYNNIAKNTMAVITFEKIKQFLHFANYSRLIPYYRPRHDRFYFIIPILEILKKKKIFKSIPVKESLYSLYSYVLPTPKNT